MESKMTAKEFDRLVQDCKLVHVKDQQVEIKYAITETITEVSDIVYVTRWIKGYIVSEFKYSEDEK